MVLSEERAFASELAGGAVVVELPRAASRCSRTARPSPRVQRHRRCKAKNRRVEIVLGTAALSELKERVISAFKPNRTVDGTTALILVAPGWRPAMLAWLAVPFATFAQAGRGLDCAGVSVVGPRHGAGVYTTLHLILAALCYTVIISMAISYAT